MISGKLVHLIEQHGEQIITRVLDEIRRDPSLANTRPLLDTELRGWGQDLLEHLGHWLSVGMEEDLGRRYERIGRVLYEHDAPLYVCLRGLFLIREKMLSFIEEQMPAKTGIEVYAEEETEQRLTRFFDFLAIHLARGYERALRKIPAAIA